ncbi:hypothetical protein ACHQM5_027039 [Ranunculus cassubicifolius]
MPDLIVSLVQSLHGMFSLKDLGPLHYFLGVEAIHCKQGLFLSQANYIRSILARTHMDQAKPVSTPMATKDKLCMQDGSKSTDATEYRSVIGALQYLSLTRPGISFTVNRLTQYAMSDTHALASH